MVTQPHAKSAKSESPLRHCVSAGRKPQQNRQSKDFVKDKYRQEERNREQRETAKESEMKQTETKESERQTEYETDRRCV